MRFNNLTKLLVGLLAIGSLAGCSVEGGNSSTSKASSSTTSSNNSSSVISSVSNNSINNSSTIKVDKELPQTAKIFIDNVYLIDLDNISLSEKDELDGAYFIYGTLTDDVKSLQEVIKAKEDLDAARDEFIELYENYLIQREAEETGYAFAGMVEEVKDLESLVRDDKDTIDNLLNIYESLSESAKTLSVVVDAKEDLDVASAKVNELISMSDDEYAIIQFTALVNKLPSVTDITILDVDKVNAVVDLYNSLSSTGKSDEKVIEAKATLDTLVERSNELLLIQDHADAFIDMVWSLPTSGDLEWHNDDQNDLIKAAEDAYLNLTDEEKAVTGVSSAYNQLLAVRDYFDNMKQPYDIKKLSFSMPWGSPINVNDNTNYTCEFQYAPGGDHISVLVSQYNIPRDEITNHVRVYLNMYIEAGAVAGQPLYQFDITEDWSGLNNATYVAKLKELAAAGDDRIYSGMGICFTLRIESISDSYASSKYSEFMARQKIYWGA